MSEESSKSFSTISVEGKTKDRVRKGRDKKDMNYSEFLEWCMDEAGVEKNR